MTHAPTSAPGRLGDDDIQALLADVRHVCEPLLRESVGSLPEPLKLMAGYHFGWWDATGRTVTARSGKMLRPALLLAAAQAHGSTTSTPVPAAVAVELLHNFSLVHDDVMDGDPVRYDRPTVWRVWGTTDALLLGDALHALATDVLAGRLPPTLAANAVVRAARTSIEMCRGQQEDCAFESRTYVGVDACIRMETAKTGALMGLSCALGGLCAGADPATIESLDRFGRTLGLAFQFTDDLLGIWGDPAVTGKPAGADLVRRKHSLPVAAAMASGHPHAAELVELYGTKSHPGADDTSRVAALVEAAGGRHETVRRIREATDEALASLPETSRSASLRALVHAASHRDL